MFSFWVFIGIIFCPCQGRSYLNAFSRGDIIIGGLFPIHLKTDGFSPSTQAICESYDIITFLHTQVMVYAIAEVNGRTPRPLPNITLGYEIYDTCGDVTVATRAALQLLKSPMECLLPETVQMPLPQPTAKVVIGEMYSEVSIGIARVLPLSSVAQISPASTSELLSRKSKFPTFLRTISSDVHQTKGIAELVRKFNWKTVAIVGSDDEYGRYGSDRVRHNFRDNNVCIDFVEILPDSFLNKESQQSDLLNKIRNSTAEAIVLFTKHSNVKVIMKEAVRMEMNRTWIASDSWSTSSNIGAMPGIHKAGRVFGFISKRNPVPGFEEYVLSMFGGDNNTLIDHHLKNYPLCSKLPDGEVEESCQSSNKCLSLSCLASKTDQDVAYNTYLAVQVIVRGLQQLLKCDDKRCQRGTNFTAAELLEEIKKVDFYVNKTHLYFDKNGDLSIGYDIVYWKMGPDKKHTEIQTVGQYRPDGNIIFPDHLVDQVNVSYNCWKTCNTGYELKKKNNKKPCCFRCVRCGDTEYSLGNGTKCESCETYQYPSMGGDRCLNKTKQFLQWSVWPVIILTVLEILGVVVTITFVILFAVHHHTPIVKAVGGYFCFLELFSLLACFCLTFCFTGLPTTNKCMVVMPLFGISFSLCMSCILANLLQILVGFMFNPRVKKWLKKLNQPWTVVFIITGIQVAICVSWLCLYPPKPYEKNESKMIILLFCDQGSIGFFSAMLGYNGFLAIICFLFAFKGRQLPDLYKNARLVAVSMLVFLIIWIIFIPIYLQMSGTYKQLVESMAILISCYGILCCHLAPKCFIMVFKKELNNQSVLTEYVRRHYEQKGVTVVKT